MSKISELLSAQGHTAIWLANKIGKSKHTIHKYSHGDTMPPGDVAKDMAEALGTTVGELFPGKYTYCGCCQKYNKQVN